MAGTDAEHVQLRKPQGGWPRALGSCRACGFCGASACHLPGISTTGISPRSTVPANWRLYVANLLANPHPPEEPAAEVTVLDAEREVVIERLPLPGANVVYGITAASDGTLLLPLIRTKNLVPLIHVAGGWTITNGLGLVLPGGVVRQLLLDGPNRHFADPPTILSAVVVVRAHRPGDL
ncbi:MAG: hypothetical protein GY856_54755 [bacterium]|nr:hypothetical protein [bacterium]